MSPIGKEINLDLILDYAASVADFLLILGPIIAAVVIIGAGILYLTAGDNSGRVKSARDMFKAGILGAIVIFGSGVIMGTLAYFGTGNYFGSDGSATSGIVPGTTYGCNSNGQCVSVVGGMFADSTCGGTCSSVSGTGVNSSCVDCTNTGQSWCIPTAGCISYNEEVNCPGVFTRISGGCFY